MGKIALAVIVSLWAIPITILVNHIVPEPYMDEIFHIPQAQKYCKGDFGSWDPMITTPPGLKFRNKIWVLAYFVATAMVLVPAPLIEFRYYTIPFFFLVLHSNNNESGRWYLTGMLYICVNVFTMMMFLFRPFSWTHEPGIQRFIW